MKLLLLLILPILSFGQNVYSGKIINAQTGEGIAYATVTLTKANTGTNADENGRFALPIYRYNKDTLTILCIGYQTLKVVVTMLPIDSLFRLNPKTAVLTEVMVRANKEKEILELNYFSGTGLNARLVGDGETQIAQPFECPVDHARLLGVHIAKRHGKALFRLRVYDADTISGAPFKDLADTVIQVSTKKSHVRIDLREYKIYPPKGRFFIAVEWLKIPENAFEILGGARDKKTRLTVYKPELLYRNGNILNYLRMGNITNYLELPWHKNFNGKWEIETHTREAFRISATIGY